MKFVVAGAGAIGAYVGAKMARAGLDVALFARGAHLRAMQERGVRVREAGGEFVVRPQVFGDLEQIASEVGLPDVILLGVKAHALPELAPRLKPLLGPHTAVVSMQNGIPWWYFQLQGGRFGDWTLESVDPGGMIARAIEARRVLGSIVYLATEIEEPGIVRHVEGDRISLGEINDDRHAETNTEHHGRSERVRTIADALTQAGFRCRVTPHIRQEIWVKAMGNAAFNPVSALTGATMGAMATHPELSAVLRDIMAETESVARQLGVELPISIDKRMAGAARTGEHKTSMLQDLEAGRPLELDALVGAILEIGGRVGVATPTMRTVYTCAKALAGRRAAAVTRNVEQALAVAAPPMRDKQG